MKTLFHSIIIVFLFHTSFADKTIPVFMMDHDKVLMHVHIDPDPFARLSSSSFSEILHDTVKRSEGIIIFIENTLSSEDISMKDKYGSPFPNLRAGLKDNKVKYFPAVIEPYKMLTQILQPQQFNVFYLRTRTKLQLVDNFKYIYIFFQDGSNETRAEILRRHDSIMREVIFVIRQLKPGPVIAFYTGKQNPVVLPKVQFVPMKPCPSSRDLGVFVVSSGALFRFSGVFAATTTRRSMFNQLPMVAEETFRRRSMTTKMAYTDFELEFNFSFKDDGWLIDNVALLEAGEEVGRTEMGVGAPWNWSYVCGEPLVIVNTRDGSSVTISQYQIQPRVLQYRRDTSDEQPNPPDDLPNPPDDLPNPPDDLPNPPEDHPNPPDETPNPPDDPPKPPIEPPNPPGDQPNPPIAFGKSINCGPYYNSHILSGLFVTVICVTILLYGIMMIFDCVSNDSYEDPQGKALTHEVMH